MITIGVSGAPGKMGRLSIATIGEQDDVEVGGLYAPGHDGEDVLGHRCGGSPEALDGVDVVIELTNPQVAPANVDRWRRMGSHVVIGTSGYDEAKLSDLRGAWQGASNRCLVVPNFSIGAVLMMRFAELAAGHFETAEIIEMHHHDKPDAPSGTSLNTAARMAAARVAAGIEPHPRGSELVAGALGADVGGVPIHSMRAHGAVAHQEVVLGTLGQYLSIRHDTTDYRAFAPGIVLALRSVSGLDEPVTVGMDSLLGV